MVISRYWSLSTNIDRNCTCVLGVDDVCIKSKHERENEKTFQKFQCQRTKLFAKDSNSKHKNNVNRSPVQIWYLSSPMTDSNCQWPFQIKCMCSYCRSYETKSQSYPDPNMWRRNKLEKATIPKVTRAKSQTQTSIYLVRIQGTKPRNVLMFYLITIMFCISTPSLHALI